jgi:hypothetical protein
MSEITPMEAYATTDGRLFTDPIEAKVHQHGLDIGQEVKDFFGIAPVSNSYFADRYEYAKLSGVIAWEMAKKSKELKEGGNG